MDRQALQILDQQGDVLQCHRDRWDAIYFGEIGSSLAVLNAGFNIDSFILRYALHCWFVKSYATLQRCIVVAATSAKPILGCCSLL